MSASLEAALSYAARGWPVFPCAPGSKRPMTQHGFYDASTDPAVVGSYWRCWPHALIGMPTGEPTDLAVLDVDMKNGKNGLRTLAGLLGTTELSVTPTAWTASGGLHLHFRRPEGGFGNTVGAGGRGIGDGLDWRCDGGYVVMPAPGTGYSWDENSYETCAPIAVPELLLPRQSDPGTHAQYASGVSGRLAGAISINSLSGVARKVAAAKAPIGDAGGERNALLFWGACRFDEAVAQGLIDEDDARRILAEAAARTGLPDREIARTIESAFGRADR
jgi:hypothetical protein